MRSGPRIAAAASTRRNNRLCQELRDALAIVVSQDGGLRFVRWDSDEVTCWDQVATAPFEV